MNRISSAVLALVLAVIGVVAAFGETDAMISWKETPVVSIDGEVIDIKVGTDPDVTGCVSQPTQLIVRHPVGVSAVVVETDSGFGHGYTISFSPSTSLEAENAQGLLEIEVIGKQTGYQRSTPGCNADQDEIDFGLGLTPLDPFSDRIAAVEAVYPDGFGAWQTITSY